MKNEINLLPQRKKTSDKDSKELRLLRFLSIGVLVVVVSLSIGSFFITALSPLPELRKEEDDYSSQLDALRPKAAQYMLIQNRLKGTSKFLTTRPIHPEAMADIESEQKEDSTLTFTGIEINGQNVTLTATSPSLAEIDTLIKAIKVKSDEGSLYKNLSLSKFEYKASTANVPSTGYNADLTVQLK
jgi:hypothetical protein